jgi:hypothetical protein
VAEAAELAKAGGWGGNQWYDLACIYAAASDKVAGKKQEYGDRAVGLLRRAVEAGFKDVAHAKKDPDLGPLRHREDFKEVLAGLERSAPARSDRKP